MTSFPFLDNIEINQEKKQDKFDKFISPDEGLFERNMYITNRAVVGFWRVVRPLNAVELHRVPKARVGGARERVRPPLFRGMELPHENFVNKDD